MGKQFMGLVSAMAVGLTLVSGVADAKPSHHRKDDRARYEWRGNQRNWEPSRSYRSGNYRERRLGRNDQIFRGHDGRAYCRRSDGTTGLVIGGVGGALLANLVGGKTLGTIAAGVGGALLGREIDRGKVKCR